MKCSILFAFLIIFIFALFIQESHGQKTCKQLVSDITKRQLGGISKCTKQMKFKNGKEKSQKMTCILKCVMIAEGFLNAEGKLTKEQFDAFTQREFAGSKDLEEKGIPLLDTCRTTHADKLDPNEEFCKTYDPLIKCMLGALGQMCPS